MDFSVIGKEIRSLRQSLGISQSELSDGICTQSQISKIEKGEVYPLANTLYFIAERLGVDVNYFYELATVPHLEYVKSVKVQVRKALNTYNYKEVYEIIEGEKKNPLFTNNRKNKQFLLWNEGICLFYMSKNKGRALELMEEALEVTRMTSKLIGKSEIEIINSIGIIHSECSEYHKAIEKFNLADKHFEKLPFNDNYTIKTKIIYNTSKAFTELKNYTEAITYSEKGIEWCLKNNSIYLLGQLYYHIGYNHSLLENDKIAIIFYKKALTIFELQNNNEIISYINEKLNELKQKN
ncbi:helix-turn-helix domain-containing protein [Bacillus sp. FJAT-45066]|uniref:helix-turn-helix domain-containing protein n=1 Tax=Bacillus sp. FJAT-45066 TaxID=2011010 RepID=UPI0015968D08|nr:helix-turn-helix domain-containing protein [Bacillus sp. FJAT-45066]